MYGTFLAVMPDHYTLLVVLKRGKYFEMIEPLVVLKMLPGTVCEHRGDDDKDRSRLTIWCAKGVRWYRRYHKKRGCALKCARFG